jgi:hypothetical protein
MKTKSSRYCMLAIIKIKWIPMIAKCKNSGMWSKIKPKNLWGGSGSWNTN